MNTTLQAQRKTPPPLRGEIGAPARDERLARLALHLGVTSAALTAWLHIKPRTRGLASNLIPYGLKIVSAATAPILSAMGLTGALLARQRRQPWNGLPGLIGALLGARFIWKVLSAQENAMPLFPAPPRTIPVLPLGGGEDRSPARPRPQTVRNLVFTTVPGTDRDLLCDLWEPGKGVNHSGMSIIYLHGGAWQSFDKDVMTRSFFRHLVEQGHVVMDVAYRMIRETDMHGMLGDVKRAIAWLKLNSATLGLDPAKVIISGGSAGGHLALLAGYTPNSPAFDPEDTRGSDTSVRAVVAFYPVADLRTLADYWSEQAMHPLATAVGRALGLFSPEGYLPWSRLAERLFGGPLNTISDALLAYSPVAHVGPLCPPTLILQGLHDHVIPVEDVFALHAALVKAGRPATLVPLPMVEHAFDMLPLRTSPPSQVARRAIDRFLAQVC